jgi:hypothetical protein
MMSKRRSVIQLTPLLDLLIILVFALLLGLRQQGRTEEDRTRSVVIEAVPELSDEADPVSALVSQHRRDVRDLEQAREQARTQAKEQAKEQARKQNARLAIQQDTRKRLADELARSRQQQARIGDLVAELFRVPDELLDKALAPDAIGGTVRSPAEASRLKREFRELASKRGREVVRHLLTFEEMRKRCDVWDLVIVADHRFELTVGTTTRTFEARTAAEFDDRLFRAYKSLEQPKDLVIVMLAWRADARFLAIETAIDRLPRVTERMRNDRSGQTQFQFLVLSLQDDPDTP